MLVYECVCMRMWMYAFRHKTHHIFAICRVSLLARLAHKAVDARLSLIQHIFNFKCFFSFFSLALSLARSLSFRMWWIHIMKETSSVKHDYSLACKYESKNVTFLSIRFNCAKLIFPHKWIGKERKKEIARVCVWESDVAHTAAYNNKIARNHLVSGPYSFCMSLPLHISFPTVVYAKDPASQSASQPVTQSASLSARPCAFKPTPTDHSRTCSLYGNI